MNSNNSNSNKRDFFFVGHFEAEQPLSFTVPAQPGYLPTMGGKLFMTASGIRGALRRCAEQVVTETRNWTPSLDDYFSMVLGGVKGSDKNADANLVSVTRFVREKNPLLSLFGGMAPVSITGKLKISHAVARNVGDVPVEKDVVSHVRTNDLTRNPAIFDALDEQAAVDYRAFKEGADERSDIAREEKSLKQEMKKAIDAKDQEEVDRIKAKLAALKDDKRDKKVVQLAQPDLGYEAIPAGTLLDNEFVLLGATDLEAGLFLAALDRFARRPYLGGHQNHGLGRVSGFWKVSARDEHAAVATNLGEVALTGDFSPLVLYGAVAHLYGDGFMEQIASSDLDFSVSGMVTAAA